MIHLPPIIPPDPPLSDSVVTLRTLGTGDIVPLHSNLADEAIREYLSIPLDQAIEGTARYGLGITHIELAQVNGFIYQRAMAFGAPPDAAGPPPKLVLQILTRVHPGMRARWRTAAKAIEGKIWRDDLRRWDEQIKPAAIRKHREIQAVDTESLGDDALLAYVERCHGHARDMVAQHHQFTATAMVPVGDLLAHVTSWTGMPAQKVLDALRGSSPVSKGVAAEELDVLADAIRADDAAKAMLQAGDGAEAIDALLAANGPVGPAARAYIEAVGYRCLGYDLGDPCALEMPSVLVRAIRTAVARTQATEDDPKPRVAALRESIPAEHRDAFDGLFTEARLINRLRDERAVYSDGWATGLLRRALMAVGRRLAAKGLLDEASLIVDASSDEVRALVRGERAVTSAELRDRAAWRATANIADAPSNLGAPPAPPPPAEWFPEIARRSQRATLAFLACLFNPAPETPAASSTTVTGLPVNTGTYEGIARLVHTDADFAKIQQGDVLVTRATSPYFNVVLPMLGAIVTDRGGQLSHAAIVAREYGIPGVVGARDATARIPDGARVRVDGTRGEVEVLG